MLRKYFVKSRHQLTQDIENTEKNRNECGSEQDNDEKRKRHSIHDISEELQEEYAFCFENQHHDDIFQYQSHLSMALSSIIGDPICLSYFVQYLEDRNALALVKFYLDTENFKKVAVAQKLKIKQEIKHDTNLKNVKQNAQEQMGEEKEEEEQNFDKNNVPELKSLYDLSMRKPLTDDEKSQIYADVVSKQISKNPAQENEHNTCCSSSIISATSVEDAMIIYQKYLSLNAKHFINIPIEILSQISLLICKNNDDHDDDSNDDKHDMQSIRYISLNCFDEAQKWVLQQLEDTHLNDFLQSKYYFKYCVELIENHNKQYQLNICDILYSESTLFYFMEFLEQHSERECLDFWTQAINYRKTFNSNVVGTSDAQTDAMIIYDKYFSLQAECRLWLSDKVRHHVEQLICGDNVALCYDLPLRLIAQYLEHKYLNNFLQSQLFTNYVKELKEKLLEFNNNNNNSNDNNNAISNNESTDGVNIKLEQQQQKRGHRKTRSVGDTISHKNTLLAMDTLRLRSTNMNIDARQLTEPQLLWHRRHKTNKLTFGTVNALGRFERDFENVDIASFPSNWSLSASGNKIKNAMRKFVNLPEDNKMQEEIAWQVAEMIVKDVTSITLKQ